jgi:hypothetical protein
MVYFVGGARLRRGLAVAGLVVATALGSSPTLAQEESYPQQMVEEFLQGCVRGGGTETACSCTLRRIQSQLTLADFANIWNQMRQTGQVPTEIAADIASCTQNPDARS